LTTWKEDNTNKWWISKDLELEDGNEEVGGRVVAV
jgi:hypothetical protein